VFNVMKKARGLMCCFLLCMFRRWTEFRTCDVCWGAPTSEPPHPPPTRPSTPPVVLRTPQVPASDAVRAARATAVVEANLTSESAPATRRRPGRCAALVATLAGVIDWGTKLTMTALVTKVEAPAFLKSLAGFSVLRFAIWQRIDSAPPTAWQDRPMPLDALVDPTHGVPIEVMVELANQSGLDPWFCVPHWADDNYVRSFAELVKQKLDPERRVYVEHSNDVGNDSLPQHHFLCATARASVARFGDDNLSGAMKCHAARSLEIFRIWQEVFADPERVVRVLGVSAKLESSVRDMFDLEFVRESVDAVVLGPVLEGVVGEVADAARSALAPAAAIRELATSAVDGLTGEVAAQAALAARFNMRLFVCDAGAPASPE